MYGEPQSGLRRVVRSSQGRGEAHHAYERRAPAETVLYEVVREQWETFLAHAAGSAVPNFVEREVRAYLACGILAYGFVRVHCDACGHDRVVGFSCKGRGFCPSWRGRRTADTAAFLVDNVLPIAPVRQWVLSLPFALRYRLAYDSTLAAAVLQVFVRSVFRLLRRRVRRRFGRNAYGCGAGTFVQRSGDALNLNVHLHTLALDGVVSRDGRGAARFRALPPPTDAEVERTTRRIVRSLRRLLLRRGLVSVSDADACNDDTLAEIYSASVRSRTAIGERAGRRVLRVGDLVDPEEAAFLPGPRCASIDGVSLHADVSVPARDRRSQRSDSPSSTTDDFSTSSNTAGVTAPRTSSSTDSSWWRNSQPSYRRRACTSSGITASLRRAPAAAERSFASVGNLRQRLEEAPSQHQRSREDLRGRDHLSARTILLRTHPPPR